MRLFVSPLLLALVTALLIPISASAQTINGCVKNKNGALRIVADPSFCTSREMSISWNQQGPQGDPGIDGVDGAPGADGSDAEVLRMFDVTGAELGIFLSANSFFHEPTGVIIAIKSDGSLDPPRKSTALYESSDCSGTPLMEPDGHVPTALIIIEEGLVAIEKATLPSVKTILSGRNSIGGECFSANVERLTIPTRSIVLSDFDLNFPLPVPIYADLLLE